MEFNEKLQELRKQKGFTQEELAEALYVSRTAISKWESGRGYPSIDSLKSIAKLFSVTLDELLSGDELLTIAEEDGRQKEKGIRDIVWGLLDFSVAVLFFLPFFAHRENGIIEEVSLLNLNTIVPHLKIVYLVLVLGIILSGVLTLALQNSSWSFWKRNNSKNISDIKCNMHNAVYYKLSTLCRHYFIFVFNNKNFNAYKNADTKSISDVTYCF